MHSVYFECGGVPCARLRAVIHTLASEGAYQEGPDSLAKGAHEARPYILVAEKTA